MDNTQLSEGIAKGDNAALACAKNILSGRPSGEQVAAIWKGTIEAMLKGDILTARAMKEGLDKLNDYSDAKKLYEFLIGVLRDPRNENTYIYVVRIAAEVARMNSGKVIEGVDNEFFAKIAGLAFIEAIKSGDNDSRKCAADIALSNVDSKDVVAAVEAAQNDRDPDVRKIARKACERYAVTKELEAAQGDRQHLLAKYAPGVIEADFTSNEPSSPQTLFIDMTYAAIETILKWKIGYDAESMEVKSAAHQLASFAKRPDQLDELFIDFEDKQNLDTIKWSAENALLHALKIGSQSLKEDAVDGLGRIGDDRVQMILGKIILHEKPGTDTYKAATDAHNRISARKLDAGTVLPHLRPAHKPHEPGKVLAQLVTRRQ